MSYSVEANTLAVGDIILNGIAGRVESIEHREMDNAIVATVIDANGFSYDLKLNNYADVTKLDWTPEKWAELFKILNRI